MIGAVLDTDVFSIIIEDRPRAEKFAPLAGRLGHPLCRQVHSNDLWIAACAVFYRVPLVTGNGRHFVGLPGLTVLE